MKEPIDVRMLVWDDDHYCFYALGHLDKEEFLRAAISVIERETGVPEEPLSVDQVKHKWFAPMSPTTAKEHGWDWGVIETQPERRKNAYRVTVVKL